MPVARHAVSLSMFAELLGLQPAQFVGVEYDRRTSSVTLVLEPEEDDMQTTGTFPQIHSNANYGKGKSGSAKTPKSGGAKKH